MNEPRNMPVVMEYVDSIIEGRKVACVELVQACERFRADLANPAYEFRPRDAEYVIGIIEATFVHVKGDRFTRTPFKLEPWEKFIVYNILGFFHAGTTRRRFREAFIFIPRKNGKTTFVAAMAWALALLTRAGTSTIYIVASVLKQAAESFAAIKKNIGYLGETAAFRIRDNNAEHSIERAWLDEDGNECGTIHIEALASNPEHQDGFNAPYIIADELHAYKSANNYMVMQQAAAAYENGMVFGITTAGTDMATWCYHRFLHCQRVLRGEVEDESYFIFIAKADNPDDYTNPIEHEKANPNYGVTVQPAVILAEAQRAQNDPSTRHLFLNKNLNIYTNALNAYFNVAEAATSDAAYSWTLEELARLPIMWYGGADLSLMHDLTAACLYGRYQHDGVDVDIVIAHGFIPIVAAHRKAEADNIPFFGWKDNGWLTVTNTEVVDHEAVVSWFVEMRQRGFRIHRVGFDKQYSRDFVASMARHKFRMINQDQAYWKKSEAFREIERQIKRGRLYYLHNMAFEFCLGNVRAVEDSNDKVRYEKTNENRRIDLFDAAVMACKQLLETAEKAEKARQWADE